MQVRACCCFFPSSHTQTHNYNTNHTPHTHTQQAWEPAHRALPARRFVSGSKDMTVRVWDANTRRCIFSMSSHTMVRG